MTPASRATTEGRVRQGTTIATLAGAPRDRAAARRLGRYLVCSMASSTRLRVLSRTCGLPLRTRETVPTPTPARAATSAMRTLLVLAITSPRAALPWMRFHLEPIPALSGVIAQVNTLLPDRRSCDTVP